MHTRICLDLFTLWPVIAAGFNCTTPSENTVIVHDAVTEQAQYGAASEFKLNFKQPWPLITYRQDHKHRVIKYCYADKPTRDKLHCIFQSALAVWADKLGGFPTKDKGHCLASLEASSHGYIEYCFDPDGKWNSKVESGTFIITENLVSPYWARASIGYDPTLVHIPDRHFFKLGAQMSVASVAHEIGHVLGMIHEMCRSDRDEYLLYQCHKFQDYNDALSRAMKGENLNAQDASIKLCEDIAFAGKYNFVGGEYVKDTRPHNIDDGEFDVQSIMLYR